MREAAGWLCEKGRNEYVRDGDEIILILARTYSDKEGKTVIDGGNLCLQTQMCYPAV